MNKVDLIANNSHPSSETKWKSTPSKEHFDTTFNEDDNNINATMLQELVEKAVMKATADLQKELKETKSKCSQLEVKLSRHTTETNMTLQLNDDELKSLRDLMSVSRSSTDEKRQQVDIPGYEVSAAFDILWDELDDIERCFNEANKSKRVEI